MRAIFVSVVYGVTIMFLLLIPRGQEEFMQARDWSVRKKASKMCWLLKNIIYFKQRSKSFNLHISRSGYPEIYHMQRF